VEVALALDGEPMDERGVDAAPVAERQQIVLAELRAFLDRHVAPDACAEEAIVEDLERWVHGEDAAA
jgi:hypothetical protein